MQLTTVTDPERVQNYFRREGTLLAFEIPAHVGPRELAEIAHRHAESCHLGRVLELIIAHRNCDVATLELALRLADDDDSGVLNAIATSGKAPIEMLERLERSEIVSVQEHARLALIDRQLCDADDDGIIALYESYKDHPAWGYGFRYRLVIEPRTPRLVLQSIASYADPIGAQAARRLKAEEQ